MAPGPARPLRYGHLWQGIGWLLVLTVTVLSLMPQPPQPPVLTWDKAQHLLAYGALMLWFRQAFAPRRRWIVFLVLLGVGLECLQGLSADRYFEYSDMLANTLGVGCGLLLAATPLGAVAARLDRLLAGKLRRAG